jgi:hypothetical protein
VLFRFYDYDAGGIMRDPLLRVALYTMVTPLAFFGVLMSVLALVTAHRLHEWDQPVIGSAPDPQRSSTL